MQVLTIRTLYISVAHLVILVVDVGTVLDELAHDDYMTLAGGTLQGRVPTLQQKIQCSGMDYIKVTTFLSNASPKPLSR